MGNCIKIYNDKERQLFVNILNGKGLEEINLSALQLLQKDGLVEVLTSEQYQKLPEQYQGFQKQNGLRIRVNSEYRLTNAGYIMVTQKGMDTFFPLPEREPFFRQSEPDEEPYDYTRFH